MKDKHITDMLDSSSLASLSEHDLQTIRAHVESCASCTRAYQAAQVSALLINERATEPDQNINPFFQTRVMAAWREQQDRQSVPAFMRLWKTAGALVTSLALTTAALAALTFTIPASQTSEETVTAVESMVVDAETEKTLTEEQMLRRDVRDDEGAR